MEPLGDVEEPLHTFRAALLLMAPIALVVSFTGGYWLAGRALRPVDRLTDLAREISATNLRRRLPDARADDELGRLVHVFNEMIGRLDAAFSTMRRFTSDAAHELRSPLANLRSTVDVTLGRARDPAAYREALASVREEVDRLRSIVEDLLLLARADAGKLRLQMGDVDLVPLVRDVIEVHEEMARQSGVRLALVEGDDVQVTGDERWLRQVASNLVHNAVKFTATKPEGSTKVVEVTVLDDGGGALLRVADTGPGLPPGPSRQVFERFFRADPARARSATDGFGLGLSIAASVVEAHGGEITATNRPGGGCELTVRLGKPGRRSAPPR
jgi:heavy metal sensor kinase